MRVTIDQAASNALAAWLRLGLALTTPAGATSPNVVVSCQWPDAGQPLPAKAVTILRAGAREDELTELVLYSQDDVHQNITGPIAVPVLAVQADVNAALNVAASSYESHRVDTGAHVNADTTDALVAPAAGDLFSSIALATDLLAKASAHLLSAVTPATPTGAHTNADLQLPPAGPVPSTLGGLLTFVPLLLGWINAHYPTRIYTWRCLACAQPVQLNVWTTYEVTRDDLMARLDPLLNASPAASAGVVTLDQPPVCTGVALALGDGWPGLVFYDFDAPKLGAATEGQPRGEFRATFAGTCGFFLLVRAQSARLAAIAFRQVLSDPSAPAPTTTLVATVAWSAGDPDTTTEITTE